MTNDDDDDGGIAPSLAIIARQEMNKASPMVVRFRKDDVDERWRGTFITITQWQVIQAEIWQYDSSR